MNSGLRTVITVVFIRVNVELTFIYKIYKADLRTKIVLRELSFIDKTLMFLTEGCYLVYHIQIQVTRITEGSLENFQTIKWMQLHH